MKDFARKNPLIVASVLLPLSLIVVFLLAGLIPKLTVPAPQHDLILADFDVSTLDAADFGTTITVVDGKVVARLLQKNDSNRRSLSWVYRFDHETSSVSELRIRWPQDRDTMEEGDLLPISGLEDVAVTTSTTAPDGYQYRGYVSGRGFLSDLFGGGRSTEYVTIENNGAIVRFRLPANTAYGYRYGSARFIGWVTGP